MLVLTRGEAGIDCCDPFVGALLKRNSVCKYGPHIIICDLLVFTLRDGTLLSCYLFPSRHFCVHMPRRLCDRCKNLFVCLSVIL